MTSPGTRRLQRMGTWRLAWARAFGTGGGRMRGWRAVGGILLLALLAGARALGTGGGVRPGGPVGMACGILAALLLLAAALYGARRRTMATSSRWRLGSARTWLRVHLYSGALFLFLLLMHSGFRWPEGLFSWALWLLSLWVVATGFFGLFLQRWIPRVLTSGLSLEAHYDRIPELVEEIRTRAATLATHAEGPLRTLYRQQLAPVLATPMPRMIYFLDVSGGSRTGLRELEYLRSLLPGDEKERLVQLEKLYRSKLELDAHYTLQRALRSWLWLHLPASLALVALVILHILTVLYY